MSRFPEVSVAGTAVPASIFARLREHIARFPGDVIPLQIGDTHLAPPCGLADHAWADLPIAELYAYGSATGWPPLIEKIVAKARRTNQIAVSAANVQVTCGATHALSCAVQALCDPGDELILLTPHWPLIRGIALGHHVVPIEVPLASAGPPAELAERIAAAITDRTAAIYLASPNNPDGAMLSTPHLEAIALLAAQHRLWLLSDEVYEDYGYDAEHVSIGSLPTAADRTVTVFSFAKSYGQAGLRVGYALAPEPVTATLTKLVNHSVYNVPVALQRAALGAMHGGALFVAAARASYRAARDRARNRLVMPTACPAGGAYLWLDLRDRIGDDCLPFLEKCASAGVLLAPGTAFGAACGGFARLCFTGVAVERLDEGIDRINAVVETL